MATRAPAGLRTGGRSLWRKITTDYDLDAMQTVQLEEACRAKDRLDQLDDILRGDIDTWAQLTVNNDAVSDVGDIVIDLRITGALRQANTTANLLKMLLAAMRLPDMNSGDRPQQRGPRGAYRSGGGATSSSGGTVSSIERARSRQDSLQRLQGREGG